MKPYCTCPADMPAQICRRYLAGDCCGEYAPEADEACEAYSREQRAAFQRDHERDYRKDEK